jgi:hypothetical protein
LTPDQKVKYEAFQSAAKSWRECYKPVRPEVAPVDCV